MKHNIRTESATAWETMPGAEQYETLRKMCAYVKKYAAKNGQSWAQWIRTEDDLQTATAAAWIEMAKQAETRPLDPLPGALFRACVCAIKREGLQIDRTAAREISMDAGREDEQNSGDSSGRFSDWIAEQQADAPEWTQRHAEQRDPFEIISAAEIAEQIAAGEKDEQIIRGLLDGLTLTDIGEQLKISRQAVAKRLSNIRARYQSLNA